MSRTLTTRNLDHPHNRLNAYKHEVFARYRQLSRTELDKVCANEGINLSDTRKAKLEQIVERYVVAWKAKFQEVHGFPFADIYNAEKLSEHFQAAEKRRAALVADAIDHRPIHAGRFITREEFALLSEVDQEVCRTELHQRVLRIIKSGYAGVLSDGGIVDRRLHPSAIAVPENATMGSPKPLAI